MKTESDQSPSDLNCFNLSVTASNLSRDTVVSNISGFFVVNLLLCFILKNLILQWNLMTDAGCPHKFRKAKWFEQRKARDSFDE